MLSCWTVRSVHSDGTPVIRLLESRISNAGFICSGLIMKIAKLLLGAALAAAFVAPAVAADLVSKKKAVVQKAPPVVEPWNPWMLRVRALGVLPSSAGSTVNVVGAPAISSPGAGLSIANSMVPELDVSYFFTPNIAAELVLGVTPHRITGVGTLANVDVGHAWLLPPTLMFQYHFTNFGAFIPYLGVGVNYTDYFDQHAGNTFGFVPAVGTTAAITSLHLKNSFGVAGQAGFDYMLDQHWGLNVDVKKIYMQPNYNGTATAVGVGTLPINGTAHINPWLVGGGVTYKF
jgi:outer membrane protein